VDFLDTRVAGNLADYSTITSTNNQNLQWTDVSHFPLVSLHDASKIVNLLRVRVSKQWKMSHHLLVSALILFSDLDRIIENQSGTVGFGLENQNVLRQKTNKWQVRIGIGQARKFKPQYLILRLLVKENLTVDLQRHCLTCIRRPTRNPPNKNPGC
jgi:hypothetical protein